MAADADLKILRAHYDLPPDLDALTKQGRGDAGSGTTPPEPTLSE